MSCLPGWLGSRKLHLQPLASRGSYAHLLGKQEPVAVMPTCSGWASACFGPSSAVPVDCRTGGAWPRHREAVLVGAELEGRWRIQWKISMPSEGCCSTRELLVNGSVIRRGVGSDQHRLVLRVFGFWCDWRGMGTEDPTEVSVKGYCSQGCRRELLPTLAFREK